MSDILWRLSVSCLVLTEHVQCAPRHATELYYRSNGLGSCEHGLDPLKPQEKKANNFPSNKLLISDVSLKSQKAS